MRAPLLSTFVACLVLTAPALAARDPAAVRARAEAGDARAMAELGAMYARGQDVRQDDDDARRWYQKAAEAGDVRAMTALGARYASGTGVLRDDAKAVAWYTKAADGGDADAMFLLASMHARGRGSSKVSLRIGFSFQRHNRGSFLRARGRILVSKIKPAI